MGIQLTGMASELYLTFWKGSLKIKDKCSSSDVNRTFVQSYLVFKMFLKCYHKNIINESFMKDFLLQWLSCPSEKCVKMYLKCIYFKLSILQIHVHIYVLTKNTLQLYFYFTLTGT